MNEGDIQIVPVRFVKTKQNQEKPVGEGVVIYSVLSGGQKRIPNMACIRAPAPHLGFDKYLGRYGLRRSVCDDPYTHDQLFSTTLRGIPPPP